MTRCAHCRPNDPCERCFQQQVIDLAHLYGWRVAHFRPARTAKGWRTPVAADGAGFPDLVLVKGEVMLLMELKREGGKPTPAQVEWINVLNEVRIVSAGCWQPHHWPLIEAALK